MQSVKYVSGLWAGKTHTVDNSLERFLVIADHLLLLCLVSEPMVARQNEVRLGSALGTQPTIEEVFY